MKLSSTLLLFFVLFMSTNISSQSPKEFAEAWDKKHLTKVLPSNAKYKDLQNYLEQLKKLGIKVDEVGRSFSGREIYQIEYGKGPLKIFMWSQMHGDEPTATSALIDLFAFLKTNPEIPWVKALESAITIRAVPMLNPDGAEVFQRRNAQSVDINRDARALQTPEGRLLKTLSDEWSPDIGFNLHNQGVLTTVADTPRQATISFLAVSGDPEGKANAGQIRNKRICAVMIKALEQFIKGNIARYDDTYNPRAFGDRISEWGTPVILVETGGLHGKDEMFLVKLNFIAYLAAFQSLVDQSEEKTDATIYDRLPFNGSGELYTTIFRNASIVNFATTTTSSLADVAINRERRRANEYAPHFIQEIGDLNSNNGLNEYDASNFLMVNRVGSIHTGSSGDFMFYKKDRKIDFTAPNFEKAFPPDAIFVGGKWLTGENLLKKLR